MRLRVQGVDVFIALMWIVYIVVVHSIYNHHFHGAGDYQAYDYAGREILQGLTPYSAPADVLPYLYPPLFAILLTPILSITDHMGGANIWFFINILLMIATNFMLSRYLLSANSRRILFIASIIAFPMLLALWVGQITILLFVLIAWAWMAYKSKRYQFCGAILMVATWTKFYPALLLVYFLWKRDWLVIRGAVLAFFVVIAVQIVFTSPTVMVAYFTEVLPILFSQGQPALSHSSHSLLGFGLRLFDETPYVNNLFYMPNVVSVFRYTIFIVMVVIVATLSRRSSMRGTTERIFDLEYSLVLMIALLFGSTLFTHGLTSLLLVLVVFLRHAVTTRQRFYTLVALILFVALINLHQLIIWGHINDLSDVRLPALALSTPFFGIMILIAIVIWLLWRGVRQDSALKAPTGD